MKLAVYARVSTTKQSPEMQLSLLREYAKQRNFSIAHEYIDIGQSGSKHSRPQLNQLMNDAKKRKFDGVLVYKFDRFARSVRHLVEALEEFNHLNIAFISYSENLDTTSPMGRAMFAIIAAIAQLERDLIIERANAGVTVAREKFAAKGSFIIARGPRQGQECKNWGRPFIEINRPIPEGMTNKEAAALLGVSYETIRRRKLAAGMIPRKRGRRNGHQPETETPVETSRATVEVVDEVTMDEVNIDEIIQSGVEMFHRMKKNGQS